MNTIYIAGPMRGIALYNFPAFDAARDRFRDRGWNVISPADIDRTMGLDPTTLPSDWDWFTLPEGFDIRGFMSHDLPAICTCDAIALLPGWEKSAGTAVELALAKLLKLTICNAQTAQVIEQESILQEAQRITRGDRQDDYGHPLDEHQHIADLWSTHLGVTITAEQVAECMILLKLARNRHRRKRDNHVDIAGYADCLHRIVEKRNNPPIKEAA